MNRNIKKSKNSALLIFLELARQNFFRLFWYRIVYFLLLFVLILSCWFFFSVPNPVLFFLIFFVMISLFLFVFYSRYLFSGRSFSFYLDQKFEGRDFFSTIFENPLHHGLIYEQMLTLAQDAFLRIHEDLDAKISKERTRILFVLFFFFLLNFTMYLFTRADFFSPQRETIQVSKQSKDAETSQKNENHEQNQGNPSEKKGENTQKKESSKAQNGNEKNAGNESSSEKSSSSENNSLAQEALGKPENSDLQVLPDSTLKKQTNQNQQPKEDVHQPPAPLKDENLSLSKTDAKLAKNFTREKDTAKNEKKSVADKKETKGAGKGDTSLDASLEAADFQRVEKKGFKSLEMKKKIQNIGAIPSGYRDSLNRFFSEEVTRER